MSVTVPHLAFPFRLAASGQPAVIEQDTADDHAQCVRVLLSTMVGERLELPEYGIPDPTFETGIDLDEIRRAIEEWEPDAGVSLAEADIEELVRRIRVEVG